MFLELLLLFIAAAVAYDYLSKKRRRDMLSFLPGPKPIPILGNGLDFAQITPEGLFTRFLDWRKTYGAMYCVWMLDRVTVISTNPKDIEVILTSSKYITKNSLYDVLLGWLGNGLLTSTGPKWHSRRKAITPTFHFKILEQFIEIFDQQSAELIQKLKQKSDGKTPFDIYPYICLMALDVIAETSMGTKVNAQKNPNIGYPKSVANITAILSKRIVTAWYILDTTFRLFAPNMYKDQQETTKKLHSFTENVIQERRSALEKELASGASKSLSEVIDEVGSKKKMALLDVLLRSEIKGQPLSNADIREEVDTFMFEGHDTTTSGISFTLSCLSRHPEVQQKAFAEIREVLGDDPSRPVTLQDLNNLKYLENVIKEGLRLFPPVPLIGRRFDEDVSINGKIIPANSDLTIGIYVMLRDPAYFPNPDVFDPERHNAENTAEKINPYAYVPFSAGPRNCIGQKFAILEMKSTISKILRNFELLPMGPDVRPMISLVLRSANGVHLGLKPRVY